MKNLSLNTKILVVLGAIALLVSTFFAVYVYRTEMENAVVKAREDGMTHISRSVEMFMVSTRRFHDDFQKSASDPIERKRVLEDWNRTIFAVDQAVITDHGDEQPRVRLIGDQGIFDFRPLGGDNTKIQSEFERKAAERIAAGEESVEEIDGGYLRIAVPLPSGAHQGCAECHFSEVEGTGADMSRNIVLGSLNAYIPLTQAQAKAKSSALGIIGFVILGFVLSIGFIYYFINRNVVSPIRFITEGAQRLSAGEIALEGMDRNRIAGINNRTDELGDIGKAFSNLIETQGAKARAAEAISQGNLGTTIDVAGKGDVLGHSMVAMVESFKSVDQALTDLTSNALDGALDRRADASRYQGDYAKMVEGINHLLDAIINPVNEALAVLERVADRDLSARVTGDYRGDHARIKNALNRAVENLDNSLDEISTGATQVAAASEQIGSGSQALAQGASEQASSLEEVASSLHEVAGMANSNSSSAREAQTMVKEARDSSSRGVADMDHLSESMERIKSSSDQTAKIVKTIDEIAFQTNLLALNAAVEAARAGEAGKGFAVVAEEVRNLAIRSAEAAKNTAGLIEESVRNAEDGFTRKNAVLARLEEISRKITTVEESMSEVATASEQQSEAIKQVNQAIEQMNQVTQSTAANAEESSSAAQELSSQAQSMQNLVGAFSLSQNGRARRAADFARTPQVDSLQDTNHPATRPFEGRSQQAKPNGHSKKDKRTLVLPAEPDDLSLADF